MNRHKRLLIPRRPIGSKWMTAKEAIEHVMRVEHCSAEQAWDKIKEQLESGELSYRWGPLTH